MAEQLLVSIITVSYNSSQFIRETIESVLAQQYNYFEYIICDDRSSDGTWDIINEYHDPRIRAYYNETNLGEYANRNKGISLAKGQYLIFIDGDDTMYPHALTTFLYYALTFPDCAMLIAKDWDHRIKCPYKMSPIDFCGFVYYGNDILANFTKLFFKTDAIKDFPFPPKIKTGDAYIQLKIGQKYPSLIIPDGLTWWRRRQGNASSIISSNYKIHAETTRYYFESLDENCPLSATMVEEVKANMYGIFLRMIFWLFLKGEFADAFYLTKEIHVPKKYVKYFFVKRKVSEFSKITGDSPLHTATPEP